jgi:hypothetical protein
MYNPENRYRCTIIRGKAQNIIEDLIPAYAYVIVESEGLGDNEFKMIFNNYISRFLSSPSEKTLNNHRTEIARKLFGMYYFIDDKLVVSDRTKLVFKNEDLPFFFKSIVWNFQFPNGMDSIQTIEDKINNQIKIRPFHFIVSLLKRAEELDIIISKNDIAYYVLDSQDALSGISQIEEILDVIKHDKDRNKSNKVQYFEENGTLKASSYSMQHISEQINLLELSGVIFQISEGHNKLIKLNNKENSFIDRLVSENPHELEFDIYAYFVPEIFNTKEMFIAWDKYFSLLPKNFKIQETSSDSLSFEVSGNTRESLLVSDSPMDIGNEGENVVFKKEKERVKLFNQRLSQQKVLSLGKQRGLGYDIQSVWADWANMFDKEADSTFYIEVKSTKRITQPSLNAMDKIILTRNEWLAAKQHEESYSIFRVYLTRVGVYVYKIFNPLNNANSFCTPINYNYEFTMADGIEKWV